MQVNKRLITALVYTLFCPNASRSTETKVKRICYVSPFLTQTK